MLERAGKYYEQSASTNRAEVPAEYGVQLRVIYRSTVAASGKRPTQGLSSSNTLGTPNLSTGTMEGAGIGRTLARRTLGLFGLHATAVGPAPHPVADSPRIWLNGMEQTARLATIESNGVGQSSPLMHWVAAAFVVLLGVLVVGLVAFDEIAGRPVDNLVWYLLSYFIGVLTSLLGFQIGAGSVAASTPVVIPQQPQGSGTSATPPIPATSTTPPV